MQYFECLDILHKGTMEPRTYYIPHAPDEAWSPEKWSASSRLELLNGKWDFAFYPSFAEVPHELLCSDSLSRLKDRIPVPSCWQNHGYDYHQYINVQYPFPNDPPYVPDETPCGLYERSFELNEEDLEREISLVFDGVDSAYYVYLNGMEVGYSQVAHATAAFCLDPFVKAGSNVLKVLVLKWSDGSYLEDQDKLRMSGIFRDVYLLRRPKNHVEDLRFHQTLSEDLKTAEISLDLRFRGEETPEVLVELFAPDGSKVLSEIWEDGKTWTLDNPLLWNAEEPNLYRLTLATEEEAITRPVGFKTIKIEDGVYYWNNVPIKFKGVNRHDSDPETGAAISPEQLLRDLKLMKQFNINAVRTSHYPNSPWAYDYFAMMGFYVMQEADIEAHGNIMYYDPGAVQGEYNNPRLDLENLYFNNRHYGDMMHDPRFAEAVLDRVKLSLIREINCPAICCWSMGNEAGYGPNLEKAAEWVKSYDTSVPLQYESSIYYADDYVNDTSNLDFYSRMYPSPLVLEKYGSTDWGEKPFCCIEYAHCMGNGPGDFEDYWQMFYKYPKLTGGFAWEWCDHAVKKNGVMHYGGMFGEKNHDGNFCVDGLVSPDRKVKPGLIEYGNVLRPLRVEDWQKEGDTLKIRVKNYLDFLALDDAAYLRIRQFENEDEIKSEVLKAEGLAAGEEREICFSCDALRPHSFCYVLVESIDKTDGRIAGRDQIVLQEADEDVFSEPEPVLDAEAGALEIEEDSPVYLRFGNADFAVSFNKIKGQPESLLIGEKDLLAGCGGWNVWRAPTDNDMYIRRQWDAARLDQCTSKIYEIRHAANEDGSLDIKVSESLGAPSMQPAVRMDTFWHFAPEGKVTVETKVKVDPHFPVLPRFGLRLFLPKAYKNVRYFAYGPNESYIDKHRSSYRGLFRAGIEDLPCDYIMPQESGSRYDCRELLIESRKHRLPALHITMPEGSSFNLSRYSQEQLTECKHRKKLRREPHAVLCLDYRQAGIGSHSCGPELLEKYQFREKEFSFKAEIDFR